jgi:hypothetical protein
MCTTLIQRSQTLGPAILVYHGNVTNPTWSLREDKSRLILFASLALVSGTSAWPNPRKNSVFPKSPLFLRKYAYNVESLTEGSLSCGTALFSDGNV